MSKLNPDEKALDIEAEQNEELGHTTIDDEDILETIEDSIHMLEPSHCRRSCSAEDREILQQPLEGD
jgi:hypothetical protein